MSVTHRVGAVASTQDALHALAEGGAPSGTAVVAAVQGGGRGSRGRAWASPAGGLWLSVLVREEARPALEGLSLRAGLAVAGAIEALPGAPPVALKWPNDLLVGGRKLGGILCEARWSGDRFLWAVVGVGVNVANAIPEELAGRATALATHRPGSTPAELEPRVLAALRALDVTRGASAAELAAIAARGAVAPAVPA
ncbi:MAG: biotin--[acetyl-CoA-carboxylase] ligase [Gemmatimonadales bacterium]|nr:biotin--[acetyl-CoA-carboxylase] ligase [Gemmatimonadales bacterium]